MYKIWQFIKNPFKFIRTQRRLKELKERDPYIYK